MLSSKRLKLSFLSIILVLGIIAGLSANSFLVHASNCQDISEINKQRMERIVARAGRSINRSEARYQNLVKYLENKKISVGELNESKIDIESRIKQAKDYYAQIQSKAENFNCQQNPNESIQDFISNTDQLKRSLKELKLILIKVFLASKGQLT